MTYNEFNTYKELKGKFDEACNNYIEKRQTFDNDDYNIEDDKNEWNYVEEYELFDDEVYFVVDTSGYKMEGTRYLIHVSINDILNEAEENSK